MAIIDSSPGSTVEVRVNDTPLRELSDEAAEDTPKTVTKYVEVAGDSAFEVLVQFSETFVATYGARVEVRLDGNKITSYLVRMKDQKNLGGHRTSGVKSKIKGRWHQSNLIFSPFAISK